MERVKVLVVRFDYTLSQREIPLFRGSVISSMSNVDILFHNHTESSFRYSYPLIQYKRINGKAAIVCIGDGTDAIGTFFGEFKPSIRIGTRDDNIGIQSVNASQTLVQIWDGMFEYNLRKWIPLNQKNYQSFKNSDGIVERFEMLEKILTGNILSFAKGVGIHFDNTVQVKISQVDEIPFALVKGVKMNAFDIIFKVNVSLPEYIGLGQKVSLGYGTVTKRKTNKQPADE